MEAPYNSSAPKKPTNVSVNADLLRQARELRINLSRALEERLVELVSAKRREGRLAENRDASEEFNRTVDRRGVFSVGLRRFCWRSSACMRIQIPLPRRRFRTS